MGGVVSTIEKYKIKKLTKYFNHRKLRYGYFAVIGAALLAATVDVIGKPLLDSEYSGLNSGINPIALALGIYLIMGLFFFPLAKKNPGPKVFPKKNIVWMLLIGVAEVSAIATNFFGLIQTSVVNAALLHNGEIIFGVVLAMMIFKERLKRSECTPLSLIIVGSIILPITADISQHGFRFTEFVMGDLLILIGAFFYAIDMNITKFVDHRIPPVVISKYSAIGGSLFAFMLVFAFEIPLSFTWEQLPNLVLLGTLSTGMSSFLFVLALRILGPMRTILIYTTNNLFQLIFAWVFLNETVTILNVSSLLIAGCGIYFLRNKLATSD